MTIIPKNIIDEWNLESLDEQGRIEAVDRIGALVYQAILVRSLDILSDKDQVELDALLDKDDTVASGVIALLKAKIPTFDILLTEEKERVKELFLVA